MHERTHARSHERTNKVSWESLGDQRANRVDGIYRHPETGRAHLSVTTILDGTLSKYPLLLWYANMAVKAMIEHPEWMDQGFDAAKAQAQSYIKEVSQQAKDRGSRVHTYVNEFFKGGTPDIDPRDQGYYNAFTRFVEERNPRPVEVEMTLFDQEHRIAGTGDFFGWLDDGDGRPEVLDFKSGGAYPESLYQTAAYRGMLISEGVPVGGTRIVQLKENGRYSDRIRATAEEADEDFNIFLSARDIYVDRNRTRLTRDGYFDEGGGDSHE